MKITDILFSEIADENQKILMQLKKELEKRAEKNWILCLGAGVSISVGLPNWYMLLAKISARILPLANSMDTVDGMKDESFYKGVQSFFRDLSDKNMFLKKLDSAFGGEYADVFDSINVLESAEYIRNFIKGSLEYSDRDEEYNGGDFRKRIDSYINFLIQQSCELEITVDPSNTSLKNTTLAAVARLMKTEKDELIHNVITYNYDNLLETYLRNICGCDPAKVHSIVKKDSLRDFDDQTEWNIYHVHGRVPIVPFPGEEMSDSVILTESDYYEEERINYSWTNILQSYVMLRSNLIFIGFSGTDYNFRRIVKYVNQENAATQQRFIFFSVDDIVKAVFTREINKGKNLSDCILQMNKAGSEYAFEKLLINYLINAQTVYWEKHGLTVIWSTHEELYSDLEKLHN